MTTPSKSHGTPDDSGRTLDGSSRAPDESRGAPLFPRGHEHRCPAIRIMTMPRDTNSQGTIFGGVILSYIDQAGAIEARKYTRHRIVTVAIDSVEFHQPVYVGDVLSYYTQLIRTGRTSITVQVSVDAERAVDPNVVVPVTSATLTYVAIDAQGQPTPFDQPAPNSPL